MKYDGDAHISQVGKRFRVWIEASNVTAEVYVSRAKARELLATLDHILNPPIATERLHDPPDTERLQRGAS
jgi:hypothetical protein